MKKKEKDFWVKKAERFGQGRAARTRASLLRTDDNVAHVLVAPDGDEWIVTYSVARWYLEETEKCGVRL